MIGIASRPHLRHVVTVQIDGQVYSGCYYLDRKSITVHYKNKGTNPTLIGKLSAESRAQELLLALIQEQLRPQAKPRASPAGSGKT